MAHDHSGLHDHTHAHHHARARFGRAFALGTSINLAFVVVELGFGFAANSLALISDAVHNFSDVIGLLLAWGAAYLARRRPTVGRTYGLRRASILAALANTAMILVAVGAIALEAVHRFQHPEAVGSDVVAWVAGLGIVVNGATALLFLRGHDDLNVRAAFAHMVSDAAVSLGVVIAALLIAWTGWIWLDAAVSLLVAAVILASSLGLAREGLNLALDAVPSAIDSTQVAAYLASLPGVTEVHDLHIWAMSTTETALTAHLVRPGCGLDDGLLADAAHELERRFRIHHVTLQIEAGDPTHGCALAPADVV